MPEKRALTRLEALAELVESLSTATSRAEVAAIIVARGMKIAAADVCTVHLPGRAGELELLEARGVDPNVLDQIRVITPASGNPVLRSMQTGESIWVETEAEYLTLYPALASLPSKGPRARAFWSVPLVSEGAPLGLVGMGFYEPRAFPPDERAFVATFARQCADALMRTERAEAERAADVRTRRLRASFETMLRSIADAVIATDTKGCVTLMNPVAERLTGWREAEVLTQPIASVVRIVDAQSRAAMPSPIDAALRDEPTPDDAEGSILLHRDGSSETPIEERAAPIRDESGEVQGAVLVFRDVSAKKTRELRNAFLERATAVLAESLDYEATAARVAGVAVPTFADWCSVDLLDAAGRLQTVAVAHADPTKVEVAKTYATLYPADPDAALGLPNVIRTGKSELYPILTEEMLAAGAVDAEHLALLRRLQLRSVLFAPLVARGRVLGAVTFVHAESGRTYGEADRELAEDLGRRCALAIDNARLFAAELVARREAVVANRAKDEFVAMMSHELRTPLSSIMGWSKLIMSPTVEPSLLERGLEVIHRNTLGMSALLEDLLDLSRIASGKIRLDLRQVDLARLLETAIDAARAGAQAKDLHIEQNIATDLGMYRGDAVRLTQIVTNLLSNAVKFTPKGGRIDVTLRRVASGIELEVRDTGKGIDPAFLPHVFELFQQEDGGGTRTRGGLGLGLAISKQLVEHHGGTITASSEGPGRGARFVVRLPHQKTETERPRTETSARTSATHGTVTSLQGIRVLTVDDDDDARAFVKAALELRGATVRTAASADDALAALDREVPDVLLSDIGMPLRDGYSLLAEVRSRPPERGGRVPAAAVTAFAYAHDRERALEAGFSAHLAKPVDPSDLAGLVLRLARPA